MLDEKLFKRLKRLTVIGCQFVSLIKLIEFCLDHLKDNVDFSLHKDPLLHTLIPDCLPVEYGNTKRRVRPVNVRLQGNAEV